MSNYPDRFDELLGHLFERRKAGLIPDEDARRRAVRDVLRNGRYKPTGRGKPASEYLIREAGAEADRFPRINGPVDVCNFLSLKYVVPISLWDQDLAETDAYVFRLGSRGERFIFNEGGQFVEVEDLLVGCRVREGAIPPEEPIVNPIKDSLLTKTTPSTKRVAACIYAPAKAVSRVDLDAMCGEFAGLLAQCGRGVRTAFGIVSPGDTVEL